MSDFNSEEARAQRRTVIDQHREIYLGSGGTEGHIYDMSAALPGGYLPTLLLRTIGRKSGKVYTHPLIYGIYGDEWVIIASKGGAPVHPGWYHNLHGEGQVQFQVATQCFNASVREIEGEERTRVWDYMSRLYPPYVEYQDRATDRLIPVIMMKPLTPAPILRAD